jgi:hypothetical protein
LPLSKIPIQPHHSASLSAHARSQLIDIHLTLFLINSVYQHRTTSSLITSVNGPFRYFYPLQLKGSIDQLHSCIHDIELYSSPSPDPGNTITTPGLPRTQLWGFKTITNLEALSDTPKDPAISSLLSPEDSDINQVDAARVFAQINNESADHLEDQTKTSQVQPNLEACSDTPILMISQYRLSAISAGFDWGSDDSDASNESNELDSHDPNNTISDAWKVSCISVLDDDINKITTGEAYDPDGVEEYDKGGHPFLYTLTDRDMMISYGYKDGVCPLLQYDENDNLIVKAAPTCSMFDRGDEEVDGEEPTSAVDIVAKYQETLRTATSLTTAASNPISTDTAISAIASPTVQSTTIKVTTSQPNVATKPRRNFCKAVSRKVSTWIAKSNKTEMCAFLEEWFGEVMTKVELKKKSAQNLASSLSALQIAYIESLHDEKEGRKKYKVAEKESRAHDKADGEDEALDGDILPVYDEAETDSNPLEAETLLFREEFLASTSEPDKALQAVDSNRLTDKAIVNAIVAADDGLSSDDIFNANKYVFDGENFVINEDAYSGPIDIQ